MNVTHSDNVLTINGRKFSFEQRIQQTLVLEDRVIVRFRGKSFADDDPLKGRNIIALDENGEMLWRIQDRGVTLTTKDGREIPVSYMGLWLAKDGKTLKVGVPTGFRFDLDPETGQISNPEFTK